MVTVSGAQIAAGIESVRDLGSAPVILNVVGALVDLSALDFTGWSSTDKVTINGTAGNDSLTGSTQADALFGGVGSDTLNGGAGNDTLDGGAGADTMAGGAGDDTFIVDNPGDKVNEAAEQGTDLVRASVNFALGANVENLILTGSGNINGTGSGLANILTGNGGNNILDGKAGADTMDGKAGNDTYVVDNAGDKVIESAGQGTDTVRSSISLALGANVENLTLLDPGAIAAASANINAIGNSLPNALTGNSGNNILDGKDGNDFLRGLGGNDLLYGGANNDTMDGGTGADDMRGGTGDDTYVVDNAGDVVDETGGSGTDLVKSSISFSLADLAHAKGDIEKLVLTGSADINGTGNALANTLVGNAGKNKLVGGAGADILSGGPGKDKLLGKAGNDVFVFADELSKANADKVVKFKHGKDTFFLDQDKFAAVGPKVGKKEYFEGKKAHDKNDHIIKNGNKLFYDDDGKGGHKQVLFAKVDKKAVIDHHDFTVGDSSSEGSDRRPQIWACIAGPSCYRPAIAGSANRQPPVLWPLGA